MDNNKDDINLKQIKESFQDAVSDTVPEIKQLISSVGITAQEIEQSEQKIKELVEQRTPIYCPHCKTPLYYLKGDIDFNSKIIETKDLIPINGAPIPDPLKPPKCHNPKCGKTWIVQRTVPVSPGSLQTETRAQILTSKGWIP